MDRCGIRPALSPATNPYVNGSSIVRWLFYRRLSHLLALTDVPESASVLEIGCWAGHALPALARRFGEVWAVDDDSSSLVDNVLVRVKQQYAIGALQPIPSLRLVKADAAKLPFPDRHFDVVLLIDTLPYIHDHKKRQVLDECLRTLKGTGEMLLSLPIELGPILFLRELGRYWSNSWRDKYSRTELLRAACFTPISPAYTDTPDNLRGYDYRKDVALLASSVEIANIRHSPFSFAHALNPFMLLRCVRKGALS